MKRILFILAAALCLFPAAASASIARDGSCSATATSCTLSAVKTGDLIVSFAFRSASVTAPSLPASNTSVTTSATASGGTPGSFRVACRKAASAADTGTGTFTNATSVTSIAYSGSNVRTTANCNTTGVFATNAVASNAKTSTTASYGGITLSVGTGSSWVIGFLGDSASSVCTPTGMTQVKTTGTVESNDTNAGASAWTTQTCTVSSGTWMTYVIEVLAAQGITPIVATAGVDITASGASVTIASTTAGDLVIVGVNLRTATADTVTSITDANGDTFTRAGRSTNAIGRSQEIWYCLSIGSAQTAIVVNFTTTGDTLSVSSFQYRSFIGALALDQVATTTDATSSGSTTYTGPSITTTGTSDLLFSYMSPDPNNVTAVASPWTASATSDGHTNIFADIINASAASYAPVWTLDVADTGINNNVISFSPSATPPSCSPTLTLVHVGSCG